MTRTRHIEGGIGVAVIGSGTIGRLRAQILHRHPSVRFLGVCDVDEEKARALAADCEADVWTTDATELVRRDDVDAVIIATEEKAHFAPAMAAVEAGKHLLIEKPLTILPEEGEKILDAAADRGLTVYTGFTQRFRRRYLAVQEHIRGGYLGDITSAKTTIYLNRSVATRVMSRAPETTPSINTLTYNIDLLLWYLDGRMPTRVYAQGSKGRIHDEFGGLDSTWAVLTFADGTVANLGVSWELPEIWPAYVATMDFEVFGRDGVLSVKDDHRDVVLASTKQVPSPYSPETLMNVAMLGSAMPGDWAMGEYFGAMRDETYAFVGSVGTGRQDPILASGADGQRVLLLSRAIDESAATGEIIHLQAGT